MKIVVFSLGVVFKNIVQGGSQKVLRDITNGLAQRGHSISILCPYREDNAEIFEIAPNSVVKPILPLRGTFPLPYGVSPFALSEVCRILQKEMKNADLLYCHDGGLNIGFLKNQIPTVISLRDFCYTETLLGALNFNEEKIIVNSMHTSMCLRDSFQRVNPRIKDKISIIYNGYDGSIFKKTEVSQSFYDLTGLKYKEDEIIIGFPHRPDSDKGFENALKVIYQLKKKWGSKVKLLIPQYMDKGLSKRTDETYNEISHSIKRMKLSDNVVPYKWIPHSRMPEFYSYCDLILCIGRFVEAFSNVSVEALLCGTPVIAANTATYRTMPIKEYLNIVPYGDIDKTVQEIISIIDGDRRYTISGAREYIMEHLTIDNMIDRFENEFMEAVESYKYRKERTNQFMSQDNKVQIVIDEGKVRLSSWCQYIGGKIYDDYTNTYSENDFCNIFEKENNPIQVKKLLEMGIDKSVIEKSIKTGILVYE